ncbi:MAG TPA: O-methyltransferase [Gemmatimonadaceae bacterium]|nr:O-methyltransferase [Gemmatimonadaceae bacterium]
MSDEIWSAVDEYITDGLVGHDEFLEGALERSAAAGLPAISVSAPQGKLLSLLARAMGARRILEIGTLGGYSTIWLVRALPRGGRVVTLELEEKHAAVARDNLRRAGFARRVEIRLGPALETLDALIAESVKPFDFVFIDADKPRIPDYYDRALHLTHSGSVIIVDNVVRDGKLADASSDDPNVQGVRKLHELLAHDPRVSATTIQTVGSKGYDGFTLALVT